MAGLGRDMPPNTMRPDPVRFLIIQLICIRSALVVLEAQAFLILSTSCISTILQSCAELTVRAPRCCGVVSREHWTGPGVG